jgi:hypothetical protein
MKPRASDTRGADPLRRALSRAFALRPGSMDASSAISRNARLGRFLRTREKYITAKAASSTPPTIKIKVVTIAQFSSAGPYNLDPRSYRHERRLALGSAAILAPCPPRADSRRLGRRASRSA